MLNLVYRGERTFPTTEERYTLSDEQTFTESEVIQLVGYLTAAVPELHTVEAPVVLDHAMEGLSRIRTTFLPNYIERRMKTLVAEQLDARAGEPQKSDEIDALNGARRRITVEIKGIPGGMSLKLPRK